ncbi:NAD(P)/FAD-dependent oxidoreductase [Pseudorhodoferax sp.]|uniref:NAD(P)/FAD-dependent oxidoreductase n=1 Tax=Pseudorhodoferax sp. TaxID=1993553 RepID=UPI002DD67944|nr:FAD-dependent oxidoreductase [Pseudorhodoferax sp.]
MAAGQRVAIVGAGQAAARTVAALRQAGYEGGIALIGNEDALPYERPPLSKEALFGAGDPAPATFFDRAFYAAQGVDLLLGETASAIDATSGAVQLASGTRLQADRVVLATGARARPLALPGVAADRVLSLRSFADACQLRTRLAPGLRLVLVGGGFIGLEIAAGAARMGCQVTVVEARPRLLERAVSPQLSEIVHARHAAGGVAVRLGCAITGARAGHGETELLLSDGGRCVADLVVAGIGALPNDALAVAAGLDCGNGVVVDAHCRTRAPRIWAVGDVAARHHPSWGQRVRIESWDNAELQGGIAGRAIAASWHDAGALPPLEAEAPAWFWTDQYELNLQILGDATGADQTVVRADPRNGSTVLLHWRGGVLRGAELVGAAREKPFARKLVQAGWPLAPELLGDMGMTLKELWSAAQRSAAAA